MTSLMDYLGSMRHPVPPQHLHKGQPQNAAIKRQRLAYRVHVGLLSLVTLTLERTQVCRAEQLAATNRLAGFDSSGLNVAPECG